MAIPQRGNLGTSVSSTGTVAPAWPSHATNDIGLLICETANQAITFADAQGFAEIENSPQGTGTAGGTTATGINVFWARASSNNMTAPTLNDPGNHCAARIVTLTGCIESGNPWSVATGDATAATSAVTIPGATTLHDECLVLAIVANGRDIATDQVSGWANASLANLSQWTFTQVTGVGNGGGFNIATGELATAGAYSATTATLAASIVQGRMSIAFRPPAAAATTDAPVRSVDAALPLGAALDASPLGVTRWG